MRRIARLLLLTVLGSTVGITISAPLPAAADVTCTQTGHFTQCDPLNGSRSQNCGVVVYCQVGWHCMEWDCQYNGQGQLVVTNFVSHAAQFCTCGAGSINCC